MLIIAATAMMTTTAQAVSINVVHASGTVGNGQVDNAISAASTTRAAVTAVTFTAGVTTITNDAFANCTSLETITIPETVTSITGGAFHTCTALRTVNLTEGLLTIGANAFLNCSSLVEITIPSGVTSIGNSAFNGCSSLVSITIPSGAIATIDGNMFQGSMALQTITISQGVGNTIITNDAFANRAALHTVNLEGVTSITDGALHTCTALRTVNLPEGLHTIGASAFANCRALPSLTIPSGVTNISEGLFWNCIKLQSITFLRETPPAFGSWVFAGTPSNPSNLVVKIPHTANASNWTTALTNAELVSGYKLIQIPFTVRVSGSGGFRFGSSTIHRNKEISTGYLDGEDVVLEFIPDAGSVIRRITRSGVGNIGGDLTREGNVRRLEFEIEDDTVIEVHFGAPHPGLTIKGDLIIHSGTAIFETKEY